MGRKRNGSFRATGSESGRSTGTIKRHSLAESGLAALGRALGKAEAGQPQLLRAGLDPSGRWGRDPIHTPAAVARWFDPTTMQPRHLIFSMSLSFHDRSKNSFFGPYRRKRVNQPLPGKLTSMAWWPFATCARARASPSEGIVTDDSKTAKQPATYKSYDEMTLGERDIRKGRKESANHGVRATGVRLPISRLDDLLPKAKTAGMCPPFGIRWRREAYQNL